MVSVFTIGVCDLGVRVPPVLIYIGKSVILVCAPSLRVAKL